MKADAETTLRLFTIGHSNLSFEQFVSLLKEFEIHLVADIRRYPSSRKFPHFNRPNLCEKLEAANIDYLWLEALGGRRHAPKKDGSLNAGLRSPGFRSYADYMPTEDFQNGVYELLSEAARSRTAVMCAEKLYWKCHRRLLSDYLTARSIQVVHILDSGKSSIHTLAPDAVTTESGVIYPPPDRSKEQDSLFDLDL
ncbi:MAG: DUF488 domain-containing protein [Phycisphaerales bacterium]|nr:MAG: DUF488 domain-containing protein [Phycisphaerales bacterium]